MSKSKEKTVDQDPKEDPLVMNDVKIQKKNLVVAERTSFTFGGVVMGPGYQVDQAYLEGRGYDIADLIKRKLLVER